MHCCLKIEPRETDYLKGVSSPIPFRSVTEDWSKHLYFFERQKFSWDTNGCVLFTAQESFDAQIDALFVSLPQKVRTKIADMGYLDIGKDGQLHFHSSPRFIQILTGNGFNGNSMPNAWDVMRKYGVLPWQDMPFTEGITQETYLDKNAITPDLYAKAASFLDLIGGKNAIRYQWIINGKPKDIPAMVQALPQAPLCLGVAVDDAGWNQVSPVAPPDTAPSEHSVMDYAIVGTTASILDHYLPFEKILDSGYPIHYVLQGIVTPIFQVAQEVMDVVSQTEQILPQVPPAQQNAILAALKILLQSFLSFFALKGISDSQKVAPEEIQAIMSTSFSISKTELLSVLKGLGIAVGGAALTYLTAYLTHTDFGAYTPLVVALWSVIVNFLRKWIPNTAPPA